MSILQNYFESSLRDIRRIVGRDIPPDELYPLFRLEVPHITASLAMGMLTQPVVFRMLPKVHTPRGQFMPVAILRPEDQAAFVTNSGISNARIIEECFPIRSRITLDGDLVGKHPDIYFGSSGIFGVI